MKVYRVNWINNGYPDYNQVDIKYNELVEAKTMIDAIKLWEKQCADDLGNNWLQSVEDLGYIFIRTKQ